MSSSSRLVSDRVGNLRGRRGSKRRGGLGGARRALARLGTGFPAAGLAQVALALFSACPTRPFRTPTPKRKWEGEGTGASPTGPSVSEQPRTVFPSSQGLGCSRRTASN